MYNVAVIGAGVIGLTTAVNLQKNYADQLNITIISDKFSPNTTGDGSAGLWGPYLLGKTSEDDIERWSKLTHDYFHQLWREGNASTAGICLQLCIRLTKDETVFDPSWKNVVFGYQAINNHELYQLNKEYHNNYSSGGKFVTFTCEPTKLLPYLLKQFTNSGGKFIFQTVESLSELKFNYDAVVNCSGLGARKLANDSEMVAIRGQVMRVQAPWQFYTFLDESDDGNYIITNTDTVVLGGTHQEDDMDLKVRKADSEMILTNCQKILPMLKYSKIINEWVGLRPGRSGVRLEHEILKTESKLFHVIHNYGHGGSGVTLCWGCAQDATQLVAKALNLSKKTKINSKL